MNYYLLGLGSNINPEQHIQQAKTKLKEIGNILALSPCLSTAPVGDSFSESFANQLVVLESSIPAPLLKQKLQAIEVRLGREPKCPSRKSKDRTIDLDILGYANGFSECLSLKPEESYYQKVYEAWHQSEKV